MKILKKHPRQGIVKVAVESLDDLWYLSHMIEPGDVVSSKTERKIKIGGDDDRKQRVAKKWVFLKLEVDKVEFHKHSNVLRVKGVIISGPEDVSQGSYHTFNVEEGTQLTIEKEWPNYLLDKLDEAAKGTSENILIVVHDREEAAFGMLTQRGLETLSSIKGEVAKKRVENQGTGNFYKDIARILVEYDKKYEPISVVVASPGFWKEYLIAELGDLKDKVVQSSCSVVGDRGLQEVVKRPELKKVLEKDRTRKDSLLVDEVMEAIAKDNACYGFDDCDEKVKLGAIEKLMVSDNYIVEMREKDQYKQVDWIMRKVEQMDGEVHLISSEEEAKKLDELGGIAGVLRWKS